MQILHNKKLRQLKDKDLEIFKIQVDDLILPMATDL